ncbi:MAG: exodeoxyribonuclease VII large subunit [Prevotella sp.]|nr:exodeoxyribonuclease VII large subunit [Prevotella sp.]
MTLFELNTLVAEAVAGAIKEQVWVEAELSEIRTSHGHCYMEVVQKDAFSANLVARASAKCWRTQWTKVSAKFIDATGGLPCAGMKLLLKVSVEFHPTYGFALIVSDIDPAYTLGEMALRRQEVILKLKDEGVFDLQRELALPLFCQRIAVISSATAAGYGDFCNQMANNEYGFSFFLTLFPAIMQGEMTSQSIISQLDEINKKLDEFDCVVIIRGGGATADMSAFDTLELAENVANFPLPIITGIGHERDECVLDLISHFKAKTPTAVAAFLIDRLVAVWSRVEAAKETIFNSSNTLIERQKTNLRQLSTTIKTGAKLACSNQENAVRLINVRIANALQTLINSQSHRLEIIAQRIAGLDPNLLLRRGYTLTLADGRIVKRSETLRPGQAIETVFADGKAKSIIQQIYGNDEI